MKSSLMPSLTMLRIAWVFLTFTATQLVTFGDMLPGSEPKEWPADPAKHQVTVSRESKDAKEAAMISAAEKTQPSGETLQNAAGNGAVPAGDKVWWYKEELGIRIPCAVTSEAVEYYSELVNGYGRKKLKRYVQPSSSLDYHAAVVFHKEFSQGGKIFKDVNVVTMKLTFSQNFAATQTEGMRFQKERVVVLDGDGKVLAIFGDGPTEVPILAI